MVSFEGIEMAVVTFQEKDVTAGVPVAMDSDGTVKDAGNGAALVGLALNVRGGCAAVLVKGYAQLPYTGTAPALGWARLAADGSGGVTAAESGREYLVVQVDSGSKTLGLFL